MRTREVVDGLTEDPRLRTLLTAQWGYYGSTPSRSSFAVQALVSKHFLHGSFYPIGGTGQIAQTLLQTVADAGGWTRVATHVEEIVVDNNTAKGVVLTTGERILADRVVSAVGVSSTVHSLLPEKYRETKWARSIEDLAPGPSHISLYVGFKGDIRRAGAGKANKWIYQTWSQEQDTWNISDPDHLPNPPILYVSFSSLKDPDYDPGPDELHTGEIVTFVKWEDFKQWRANWKQRPEAYETFVTKLRDKLLADFLAHMPELEPMVAYVEISTPASSEHFCRPVAGSIYGIEPTPDRFRNKWLRPRSPITNLLFAGSEVATGGLIGAMMGGVLAATSAEPLTALRYFKDVL
jgi:all-trans-retinol 13,14-reductase